MHSVPSRESPDRQPLPLVIPANLLEEPHSAAHPFRGLRSVPRKTPTLVRHRTEVGPIQAAAPGPLRAAVLILTPSNVSGRILKPAGKTLGLGWVGFHTFRHTCASMLFEAGRNPRQVQAWLGHSDPGFTLRTYLHLMDEGVGKADFLDTAVSVRSEEEALASEVRELAREGLGEGLGEEDAAHII